MLHPEMIAAIACILKLHRSHIRMDFLLSIEYGARPESDSQKT